MIQKIRRYNFVFGCISILLFCLSVILESGAAVPLFFIVIISFAYGSYLKTYQLKHEDKSLVQSNHCAEPSFFDEDDDEEFHKDGIDFNPATGYFMDGPLDGGGNPYGCKLND